MGQEASYRPPPAAPPPEDAVAALDRGAPLHLPLPADARVVGEEPWFEGYRPIIVAGYWLTANGRPIRLGESDVVTWGTYRGVTVYVEAGPHAPNRRPDVVYLPADRTGMFQGYANMLSNGCYD